MKIKIMQFIGGLNIGGAETIVKNYSLLFDPQKIELTVVCIHNFHSAYDKELEKAGIRVIYADDCIDKKVIGPEQVKRVFHKLLRPMAVRRVIHYAQPDIIHSHLDVNFLIKSARPGPDTIIVHTVHSEPKALWNESRRGRKDRKVLQWLQKRYPVKFIALHYVMKNQVDRIFGIRDTVIFENGIDIARFVNAGEKSSLRKKYQISESAFVIGNVASLSQVKNQLFLLDVFYELQKKDSESILWLVGDGDFREAIQKKAERLCISDKVILWGSRNDVPQLLKMMDAVCFPSYYEGLSIAMIESQVAGIPAVVSDRVSASTKISNLITFAGLDEGAGAWAEKLLAYKENCPIPSYDSLEDWDIKNVVRKLEKYYEKLAVRYGKVQRPGGEV